MRETGKSRPRLQADARGQAVVGVSVGPTGSVFRSQARLVAPSPAHHVLVREIENGWKDGVTTRVIATVVRGREGSGFF